jgi:hypothetical protein
MQLNPVSYTLKETHEPSLGLISEEVREIYPEFVKGNGITYSKIVSVLISSVKELKRMIDLQQIEIERLKRGHITN